MRLSVAARLGLLPKLEGMGESLQIVNKIVHLVGSIAGLEFDVRVTVEPKQKEEEKDASDKS